MFPTNKPSLLGKLAVMLLGSLLITPSLSAQEKSDAKKSAAQKTVPSASKPAPLQRKPRHPGKPLRMAVTTVAVHTPIFVQAYDRFIQQYGSDKLELDLWVEQEWAENPRPLKFDDYDLVLALRCSIPDLEQALATAAQAGTWIISDSSLRNKKSATLIDDLPQLGPYYRQRGVSNMQGLLERVCAIYSIPDIKPRPLEQLPIQGIYHPAAKQVFSSSADYWKWYASTPAFKPGAPKIGILVYNTMYLNEETDYLTELIRGVEQAGANPVLGFWFVSVGRGKDKDSPLLDYFQGVDVLLSSSFRLMMEKTAHYDALKQLNVPILNSIILNETAAEWRASRQGISASYLLPGIVTPELAGLIEPTVIAARQPVKNQATGQEYYRTVVIPENYQWQLRRALAWSRLRKAQPADRRVAILYYNHGTGKQNIGASYLNVTASLEQILATLAEQGYHIQGSGTITRQAILDSMQSVGRNVGNWAPQEIDQLVERGAVLWPVEEYLAYFDRLPGEVKQQIVKQWGQPPGDVMTVTRDGSQFFVLPAFQLGNVLVGPQPSRAASDQHQAVYHDSRSWPTHQYLAYYFWLRHDWKAQALVHLGRHGTMEFLPGKSNGLSVNDPPGLALGDLPNIYPYIVDGIGEGVAAKRRGQAVLLTHATPPLTGTKLYEDLTKLQDLINRYAHARDQKQSGLQTEYFQSIYQQARQLSCPHLLQLEDKEDLSKLETSRRDEYVQQIEHWLAEIEAQTGPRGLHTFGRGYTSSNIRDMLPRMFQDEFKAIRAAQKSPEQTTHWLEQISQAETNTSKPVSELSKEQTTIAAIADQMRNNQELNYLTRALNGEFIEVGPPGDPLSNPTIFPTGRNQYQYNPDKLPTKEAWEVGKRMAEQTIDLHRKKYNAYPRKLSITLWANTMIRTDGALEAEVLHLLGLEPVWNRRGDLTDVKLVTPLGRPRIDVVMTVTGMYRDSFPEKILLLDRAIQLAYNAPEEEAAPNFVRQNTDKLIQALIGQGGNDETSRKTALLRIFGAPTGQYGTGVHHFVNASQQWSDQSEVAGQYLQRMSNSFSNGGWSQPGEKIFRQQLSGVQGVIHGRSSNLYGVMDLTENFEYQGALALSVAEIDGQQPDLYINDLIRGERVMSGREAIVLELLSRYHNPEFITEMQKEGFDGARYFSRIADNQFGWDVVSDAITADDWNKYSQIYLDDKYDLGLQKFFNEHNPHALQNIASRILEVDRKGLQELDEATLQSAGRMYVETIAQHGAACASHICANPELASFAEQHALASGQVSSQTIQKYRQQLQQTGNPSLAKAAKSQGGASTELATAPQPVTGQVLSPPEVIQPSANSPAAPQSQTAQARQQQEEQSRPAAETPASGTGAKWSLPVAPLVIAVCCLFIFGAGFYRRSRSIQ